MEKHKNGLFKGPFFLDKNLRIWDSETTMIKVSIIIPVYNVEQYLEECLNSLISQTLKDIEIICVNDGSTD